MKLINQPFDPNNIDCDEILGHIYKNERVYQGSRSHMRLRLNRGKFPMMEWWDERPNGAGHGTWGAINNRISGHIEKYVGRRFDDCFSDFVHKCKYNKDYQLAACGFGSRRDAGVTRNAWRERFISYFNPTSYRTSYVIENGIIRQAPQFRGYYRRSKDTIVYEGDVYYTIKPAIYRILPFIKACNNDLSVHEWITGRVSEDTIYRLRTEFAALAHMIRDDDPRVAKKYGDMLPDFVVSQCKAHRWNIDNILINNFFERVDERKRTVLKYHSKEWYQYEGNRKKKKKKVDRGSFYDRSLWASNYIKTHPGCGLSWRGLMGAGIKDVMIQNLESKYKSLLRGRWALGVNDAPVILADKLESLKNDKTIPNY